ncbi:MAG: DNA polymerase I, partial [Elusimicrobiota bacterium]
VPGVSNIGPKCASELLKDFGTLENIYDSMEKIKSGKIRESLEKDKENAFLSKTLVTLKNDLHIKHSISDFVLKDPDFPRYRLFLEQMEFYSFLKGIDKDSTQRVISKSRKYHLVTEPGEISEIVKKIKKLGEFCFDTETSGLSPIDHDLVGISLCFKKGEAYYIPLRHEDKEKNICMEKALGILKPIFEDPRIGLIGQNIKFDMMVLKKAGIIAHGVKFDTLIASYLLNPTSRGHNLDDQAMRRLNYKMIPITDLIGKGKSQISFAKVPIKQACEYSCEDADITFQLRDVLQRELDERGLEKLYAEVELPLIEVLAAMELNGIFLDTDYLKEMSLEFNTRIEKLESEIHKKSGEKFNLNSPKQLSEILFKKLGYKSVKKTKTGLSTDVDVLEELAREHETPALILAYRHLNKLKSTYIDALPQIISPYTGKVHTTFNQTITSTGRLSSSNPNLQNIPVRTAEGKEIRVAFIPSKATRVILSADYSQIELRVLAHVADEPMLCEAMRKNEDIHRKTASLIFNVFPETVSEDQRRVAKIVNFGVIYGQSGFGLSKQLGIPVRQANAFIENYFLNYPNIKKYMEGAKEFARKHGYAETLKGRRRY